MKRVSAEVAAIVSVWCATIAAIDPRGDFPLHDDWDFATATWNFARTGHFHFTNFTAVSLRAQVLWGALWTKLFGESFNVLRASTLILSLATLLVVNRILARAGAAPWLRVAAPLALLVHPIFLWASCTYMTDVPFLFASAVAFYCFLRGIDDATIAWIVAGCAAVIVSWFIRQNGVVTLLAPLAILAWKRPPRWRAFVALIVACGAFFAILFVFKRDWLSGSPAMFATHYHMWQESSFRLPEQVATLFHYVSFNAINCGLFFLPLTAPLLAFRKRAPIVLAVVAVLIAWRTAFLAWNGYLVPYTAVHLFSDILPGPVVFDSGIGPVTTIDVWGGAPPPFGMPHVARVLLTIFAAVVAIALVWSLAVARNGVAQRLAVATVVFGTLALFGSGYYFDRYSLDSAWALVIALPLIVPPRKTVVIVFLVVMALVSTFGVREYFAWQRARWTAYHDLRAAGVGVEQIDGGAEMYAFYELRDAPVSKARRGHALRPYVIAFNEMPGYRVAKRYPFRGFFGLHASDVLVLQRVSPRA